MIAPGRWRIGLSLVLIATVARLLWALAVPTVPVGDFATYRESAMQLAELGRLDHGFVYMPGWVVLLAGLHLLGGEIVAAKVLGAAFGGLAAGPLYLIVARLFDNGGASEPGQRTKATAPAPTMVLPDAGEGGGARQAPVALVTGLAYALWPAGITLGSVVGTDIPAAATMVLALALLVAWGPRRPWLAAAAFGAGMGLGAYFRAVALPLTALSAVYWLCQRTGARATVSRTALAILVTILVLVPWGVRNRRVNGEFFLTDSHGGITALMGNDPNTEGTYSRSLSTTFRELTGRTFLSEPHRETDRVAYRLARQWILAQPMWTVGMIALRLERLFAAERGLLYWSLYRPGVLPRQEADWFNVHRSLFVGVTDWYYVLFVLCLCAGFGFAWGERRAAVLVPLSLAAVQAAIYALFVAEPRYRLTTEVLLFPVAGLGAHRLATRAAAIVRDWRSLPGRQRRGAGGNPFASIVSVLRSDRRGWLGSGIALASLVMTGVLVVYGGAALREKYRWAATVWRIDRQPRLALWRPGATGGATSPVRGAPPGATLRLGPGQTIAEAEIAVPDAGLAPGPLRVEMDVDWPAGTPRNTEIAVGPAVASAGMTAASGTFALSGSELRLRARLTAPAGATGVPVAAPVTATVTAVRITSRINAVGPP